MTNVGNYKCIKAGCSNDPTRRAFDLNKKSYGENFECRCCNVFCKFKPKSGLPARKLEKIAHQILSEYRIDIDAYS